MKTLFLEDAEVALMQRLLRSESDVTAKRLLERLDAGGDRAVVQIEGGQVRGAFSNCPIHIMAIEWDESAVYECASVVDRALSESLYDTWRAHDDAELERGLQRGWLIGSDGVDQEPLLNAFREMISARRSSAPGQG